MDGGLHIVILCKDVEFNIIYCTNCNSWCYPL